MAYVYRSTRANATLLLNLNAAVSEGLTHSVGPCRVGTFRKQQRAAEEELECSDVVSTASFPAPV